MPVATVRARDDIIVSQMCANTRRDRLLTQVKMDEPRQLSGSINERYAFFKSPDAKHHLV
jgi:hypothetical protein